MNKRIDAGTDIAMVGAWDEGRRDSPFSTEEMKQFSKLLEHDAVAGHLFLVHTGGDGGGPIDVYVDAEVPEEIRKQTRPTNGEFLLSVPTGRLVVGGVEDYRSEKARITGEDSVLTIPSGDYLLRCFIGNDEEENEDSRQDQIFQSELEKAVGVDDYRYYNRVNYRSCLGYLTFLLFPVLAFRFGWKIALPSTIVIALAYFNIQERVIIKRNARYQRISKLVNQFWKRNWLQDQPPTFIFELRRVADRSPFQGGFIRR
jgi:hypothetical protein